MILELDSTGKIDITSLISTVSTPIKVVVVVVVVVFVQKKFCLRKSKANKFWIQKVFFWGGAKTPALTIRAIYQIKDQIKCGLHMIRPHLEKNAKIWKLSELSYFFIHITKKFF